MEVLVALVGLIGTVIGAFFGAWVAKRLNYPEPIVLIDRIEISSNEGMADELPFLNKELINHCNTNPFLVSTIPFGRMTEQEYLNHLRKALGEIEEALAYKLQALKEVATGMRENLAARDYEAIEKIWFQEQDNVWRPIVRAFSRKEYESVFQNPAPDYGSQRKQREVIEIEAEEEYYYVVKLPKSFTDLYFWFYKKNSSANEEKGFSQRIANAFATHNRDELDELIHLINKIVADYEAKLSELRHEVSGELDKFNRLVIKGQISNTGGTPFSVLTRGKVFILANGYPYHDYDSHKHRITSNLTRDIAIDLQLFSQDYSQNLPIVVLADRKENYENCKDWFSTSHSASISVQPGAICNFIGVSEQYVLDLAEIGRVLPKLFEAGERDFYLAISVIVPGKKPIKTYYTAPQIFRDIAETVKIQPKKQDWSAQLSTIINRIATS
jgi:hypothetical protein